MMKTGNQTLVILTKKDSQNDSISLSLQLKHLETTDPNLKNEEPGLKLKYWSHSCPICQHPSNGP